MKIPWTSNQESHQSPAPRGDVSNQPKSGKAMTITDRLNRYYDIKQQIKSLKNIEADLNHKLAIELGGSFEGTTNKTVDDMKIKIVHKMNYSIDSEELEKILGILSEEELSCIQNKPHLLLNRYKEIDHEALDQCLIVKPAKPVIEITYKEG